MARRVGGVGCGPLDDDCGAGFVVKRVDVNRWMSESDLRFFLRNNLILASWGRNYVQVGIRNIINYIHSHGDLEDRFMQTNNFEFKKV